MGQEHENESEGFSMNLPLPPSCVAFSPVYHDHLVIGTYFLDQQSDTNEDESKNSGPQTRKGSLILFQLVNGKLSERSTTPSPSGILDIAFSPHDPHLLVAATSTGTLDFYRLHASDSNITLTSQHSIQAIDPSLLILDLDFHPLDPSVIGITLSSGAVHLITLSSPTTFATKNLTPHSLETWTLSFSPCAKYLYTGGDDALLLAHPLSEEGQTIRAPRSHDAGVTAILPLHIKEGVHTLITGSYDDTLRVLALQSGRRAVEHLSLPLGGGVWRLKLIHSVEDGGVQKWTLLASCMHAGAAVVRVSCSEWEGEGIHWDAEVVKRFEEHKSMNYGGDVMPVPPGEEGGMRTVVSSSFYDKLVCVWTTET